jgi:hypothetical protein
VATVDQAAAGGRFCESWEWVLRDRQVPLEEAYRAAVEGLTPTQSEVFQAVLGAANASVPASRSRKRVLPKPRFVDFERFAEHGRAVGLLIEWHKSETLQSQGRRLLVLVA